MPTYQTEAHNRRIRGQNISIVNYTPNLQDGERNAVRNAIEDVLYEIFCKYVSSKT